MLNQWVIGRHFVTKDEILDGINISIIENDNGKYIVLIKQESPSAHGNISQEVIFNNYESAKIYADKWAKYKNDCKQEIEYDKSITKCSIL